MKDKLAVYAAILMAVTLAGTILAADMNPVMWADVPDISIARHCDTYYMVSTTMHFNPGIPVMASKDLVNWKIVSYCYDTIENRPKDNLENGEDDYMRGTWASCIRYNQSDGYFYVSSFNSGIDATYLFRTKDIEKGEWERYRLPKKMYDHSLWIEDGKFSFLATTKPDVKVFEVGVRETDNADRYYFKDEGVTTLAQITDCVPTKSGLGEGSQLFKKDGWYYLFNICWPKGYCRVVTVHRSKSIYGPWEGRMVYACEGIAQGGMIDTPDGKWFAYLFGDRGGVGRIPYMIPIEWVDDWPVFPKGRPPLEIEGVVKDEIPGCVANDEFNGDRPNICWQWNHNPDNANWSMVDGCYRITTSRVDNNLLKAKNTLTQRTFGLKCVAVTKVDFAGMKTGDVAGLALFQALFGFIGIEKTEGGVDVVLWQNSVPATDCVSPKQIHASKNKRNRSIEKMRIKYKGADANENSTIYFKAVCDFSPASNPVYTGIPASTDAARFYWSEDGESWNVLGEAMFMPYSIPHFTGYRFGLFCYSTKEAGGHADFDFFHIGVPEKDVGSLTSDGSNPIIKTSFTPDPAGYVDGDTFYLFTGHDEPTARGYKMFNWQVFKTKDMVNWENLGPVLDCGAVFPWAKRDGAWASQAIKRDGKWYWYVAIFRKGGKSCVGVATADRPEGPWKDAIGGPIVEGDGYIDPSVFVDDDGRAWLFWGNCGGDPGCWYAPLKDNMVELAGEVKPVPGLMDESAFGKPLKKKAGAGARKPLDTNFEEAPWIYKVGDTYYLEYAAGGVPEHWAYSWAKSIHGPWHFGGRIMDEAEGTGTIHGGSVFFKGEWYMVYHNATLPGGAACRRSACIERYTRNPDGTIPFIKATKEGVSCSPFGG